MTEMNARVEGFAREQLALGRTERQVVQSIVRLGHVDRQAAGDIVARVSRESADQGRRRARNLIAAGLALVLSSIILQFVAGSLIQTQVLTLPLALLGAAICFFGWRDQRRSKPIATPVGNPDGINPRLAGFARQQLLLGKGPWWIVDDMVRHGHMDKAEAKRIVDHEIPALQVQGRRDGRRAFLFGWLILAIPASIIGSFLFSVVFFPNGMSRGGNSLIDVAKMFMYLPMLFIEVVGLALVVTGWLAMKRSKDSFVPDRPSGPASTGLWWRADPFEWK